MCNEDYCSFEQCVKLKELGFNWECDHYYFMDDGVLTYCYPDDPFVSPYQDFNNSPDWNNRVAYTFSAPTLSQAQKWLREVKNTVVLATCNLDYEKGHEWYWFVDKDFDIEDPEHLYETYEQALSAGLDLALEHI